MKRGLEWKITETKDLEEVVRELKKDSKLQGCRFPVIQGKIESKPTKYLIQDDLFTLTKRFNQLKVNREQKKSELDNLFVEFKVLQTENIALEKMSLHQTSETQKIDELDRSISCAKEDLIKTQHRKAILNHMHHRSELSHLVYERDLRGLEQTLNAGSRELEQVKLLMKQLESAYRTSQQSLKGTATSIKKESEFKKVKRVKRNGELDRIAARVVHQHSEIQAAKTSGIEAERVHEKLQQKHARVISEWTAYKASENESDNLNFAGPSIKRDIDVLHQEVKVKQSANEKLNSILSHVQDHLYELVQRLDPFKECFGFESEDSNVSLVCQSRIEHIVAYKSENCIHTDASALLLEDDSF